MSGSALKVRAMPLTLRKAITARSVARRSPLPVVDVVAACGEQALKSSTARPLVAGVEVGVRERNALDLALPPFCAGVASLIAPAR